MKNSRRAIKNKYKGETALVIGNGPSLSSIPLEFLDYYPSFGTNRIYMLDGFTPTYYVNVDPESIEPFISDIENMNCEKFIRAYYTQDQLTDAHPLYSSVIPAFSRTPEEWIYEGWSVVYVCLQLTFYMGFSTVLLVGVDHDYQDDMNTNHFHPDYSRDDKNWHKPDLVLSERAFQMAKTVYDDAGRKIVNLTPGSKLDVFEKGDIAEW